MRHLPLAPFAAIALAALAACGDDEKTVTETVTETVTRTTEAPATTRPGRDCRAGGEFTVEVVRGAISCETARRAVSGYDLQGPKVQEVGAYTCEGGEADVRPVLFTCVAGDNEIVGKEPRG